MKKYKSSLLLIMLLLLINMSYAIGTAPDNTKTIGYWSWDDGFGDDTGNNINATVLGTDITRINTDCKLNDCVDSSVAGASNQLDLNFVPTSGSYSISTWCKWDAFTVSAQDQCLSTWTGVDGGFYFGYDGSNIVMNVRQDSSWVIQYSDTGISTGQWYFITLTFDASGKEIKYYRDGSLLATSSAISTFSYPNANITLMGQPGSTTRSMNGRVDETSIYNYTLTQDEIDYLYNNNSVTEAQQYPFIGINDTQRTVYQQLIIGKQTIPITITSPSYVNIMSESFNVTQDYNGYMSVTISSFSNLPNTQGTCRMLLDNNTYGSELSRTDNSNNQYGSWYLLSNEINLTTGYHTAEIECRADSGSLTFSGAVGKFNLMNDKNNNTLMYENVNGTFTTNNSEFTLVPFGTLTSPSYSLSTGYDYSLVYDAVGEVTYNGDSQLQVIIEINNKNFTQKPRDGLTGDIGIIGGFLGLDNLTPNTNYTINAYVKGDTTVDFKAHAKIFLTRETETGFLDGINETVTNTGTFSDYSMIEYNSNEISNVVVESIIPMKSVTGQDTLSARFKLDGQNGSIISRTVRTSEKYGILTITNVFEDVPANYYNVTLQMYSNNGNIVVDNASMNVYKTDVVLSISNSFVIQAYYSNGTRINNFNVTTQEGVEIVTTNGNVSLSSDINLLDFNITSSGNYKEIVIDHNINNNYNATIEPIIYYNPLVSGFCGEEITLSPTSNIDKELNITYVKIPPYNETLTVVARYQTLLLDKEMFSVNVTGNITTNYSFVFSEWNNNTYNITTTHNIREVYQESVSDCQFSICKNDWERLPTVCVNGVTTINYTDNNNCGVKYYPSDNGQYENCTTQEEQRKEYYLYMIATIILYIIFVIMGLYFKTVIPVGLGAFVVMIFGFVFIGQYMLISVFFLVLGLMTSAMAHRLGL